MARSEPSASAPWPGFTIDLRALAIMRGLLGLLILQDLVARAPDVRTFYTDSGVMGVAVARQILPAYRYSLHLLSGGMALQVALFVLAGVVALAMTVGYRSRLAAFVSYVLLGSLHARNPMIHQAGDDVLRLLVLWTAFLPCGAYLSIDARRRPTPTTNGWVSIGSIGLVAQLAMLYVCAGILKSGDTWRDGTAIFYALQLDAFSTSFGRWCLHFPRALSLGTYAVRGLELLVPLAIVSPWRSSQLKTISIVAMVALHVGLAASLHLGHFSFVCIVGWIGLLPTGLLDRLWPGSAKPGPPVVVFPRAVTILGAVLVALSALWNLSTLGFGIELPKPVEALARLARVEQRWELFAPDPPDVDGWFVMAGDTTIDLWNRSRHVRLRKPADVAASYRDMRWRKYLLNLLPEGNRSNRSALLRHLCRTWEEDHGTALVRAELVFVEERTGPNGPGSPRPRSLELIYCPRPRRR